MSVHIHRFPWGFGEDAQVWIVQFGSKSTPLIAQLCREVTLRSRIVSWQAFPEAWRTKSATPRLVILSGGDQSVTDADAPSLPKELYLQLVRETVVLGICYGAQLLAHFGGGAVRRAEKPEFGTVNVTSKPFGNYSGGQAVMNHRDEIVTLPKFWERIASTERCANALCGDRNVWAVQFHPEMDHTENGEAILNHLAFDIARCQSDYDFDPNEYVARCGQWLTEVAPRGDVLCGLSGGVDSAVAMTIARQPLRRRLRGIFIDTGWMREGELEEVRSVFGDKGVAYERAGEAFYDAVEAVPYPEGGTASENEYRYYDAVRKTIGQKFIDQFLATAKRLSLRPSALIQGTNAADIVESETGLKAHHNVGGLPARLGVDIVEPLAGLFKFEIRKLARALGLPESIAARQPFPGPGLAVRSWGKLTRQDAPPLARANRILEEVICRHCHPALRPSQYYVALAKFPSTGIMGDARVIGYSWVVRMVTSRQRESYSTLGVFRPSPECLDELAHRLTTEVTMPDGTPFVRVFYEITGKPPSTTEPH